MTAAPLAARPPAPRRDGWTWTLGAVAAGTAANALWMLLAPARWYHELPAHVPATGPYNEHFVRDIGCAFAVTAVALGWAALRPAVRIPLTAVATLFLVLHAALHLFDSWRGYLPAGHWRHDIAGVYLPAVASLALVAALLRQRSHERPEEAR